MSRCSCDVPASVPCGPRLGMPEVEREWLLCLACGETWKEADPAYVDYVYDGQAAWEASGVHCLRGHRLIVLRNGQWVCRDCGWGAS